MYFFCFWESAQVRGEREREGENLKQAPHPTQSLTGGSISRPWNQDLSRNQESKIYPTEPHRWPSLCISINIWILFVSLKVIIKFIFYKFLMSQSIHIHAYTHTHGLWYIYLYLLYIKNKKNLDSYISNALIVSSTT